MAAGKVSDPIDVAVLEQEDRTECEEPRKYYVVMFNDNDTPFDWVVAVLRVHFGKTEHGATEIAQTVHEQGRAVAGVYPHDIAETKAAIVIRIARDHGWPFVAEVQPE